MVVAQGDVFWADLPEPVGSEPGFRRPVVVVQGDKLNASRIGTVVCIPLTGVISRASAPGNVLLAKGTAGLDRDSVANVSGIVALNRTVLGERIGHLPDRYMSLIMSGIDVVLGRYD